MGILPTIVTRRVEPVKDREYSPVFRGMLSAVISGAPVPPPPVREGDFNGVGRDIGHDGRNRLVTIDLALLERKAVMADNFLIGRVPAARVIDMPRGRQNAIADRVNITPGRSVAYGDLASLNGPLVYSNTYAKLV